MAKVSLAGAWTLVRALPTDLHPEAIYLNITAPPTVWRMPKLTLTVTDTNTDTTKMIGYLIKKGTANPPSTMALNTTANGFHNVEVGQYRAATLATFYAATSRGLQNETVHPITGMVVTEESDGTLKVACTHVDSATGVAEADDTFSLIIVMEATPSM